MRPTGATRSIFERYDQHTLALPGIDHGHGNQLGRYLFCNQRIAFDKFQRTIRLVKDDEITDTGGRFADHGIHTVIDQHAVVLDVGFRREGFKPRGIRFVGGLIRIFVYL